MSDTQATPLDPETHDPADQADPADPVELEASTSSGSGIEATVETAPAEGGAPAASQGTAEATSPADEDGDEDSDEDAGPAGDVDAHDGELAVGAVAESAADSAAESAVPEKADRKARVRQLEREGEVAADFLETLLDIADLDGDIDVDVDGDRAAVAIVDSEEGRVPRRLVGPDGKVLEALQELTRLAVQVETGERSRLMLDIAGHRAQRRTTLVSLAQQAIAEVKESGSKRALEPMSAFERKVVHDEVAAAGLVSESEGVEPKRHVVVLPAGV